MIVFEAVCALQDVRHRGAATSTATGDACIAFCFDLFFLPKATLFFFLTFVVPLSSPPFVLVC